MIASFKQPRYSVLFAAMVVAVGLVTLTDAQAHEPHVVHFKHAAPLSPEAQAIVQSLEKPMSVDLAATSVDVALATITSATGVRFTVADGAVDPALRLNLKGENVPAHMVLIESMGAAKLAVKFTDSGVEIFKASDEHEHIAHGEGDRVMIRKVEGPGEPHAAPLRAPAQLRAPRDGRRFMIEASKDGSSDVRNVTLRGEDGAVTGTLRIEVVK